MLLVPSEVAATPAVQTRTSPALIPLAVAIALVATGVAMVAVAVFARTREAPAAVTREGSIRAAGAILLLFAYSFLFSVLGFVFTSAVFFAIFAFVFGARSVVKIGLGAIGLPLTVWLLFEHAFRVPLPHGLLF